jgi:glycosyltransferase involved in cell wall biosynthesis
MVTVIIPCYNCENSIDRAMQSVFAQLWQNIEIILIDNKSTDNTLKILRKYQAAYPSQVKVYKEHKPGAPAARNQGLYKAKGDYIQFLDADDELLPEKIYRQLQIARDTGADVVAGECLLNYNDSKHTIIRHVDSNPWRGLISSKLGITSSNLWRTSMLKSINGWDEAISSSQEYDLLFRLLKNDANIVADQLANTIIHFSSNSISKSTNIKALKRILYNRISLRLKIKEELKIRGQFSHELAEAIDSYIYEEIMRNYHHFPSHANELLQHHGFKANTFNLLKIKIKMMYNKIRPQLITNAALF